MRPLTTALVVAAAATLGGCADAYNDGGSGGVAPPGAQDTAGQPSHHDHPDVTTGVTTDPKAGGDARGAERVAREFAATSQTYSPDTWTAQQKVLRARATGQMARDLAPIVPDGDTQQGLAESQLTSRARVLTSDVEHVTSSDASVIVVLAVRTGDGGQLSDTPSYPVYRMRLRRADGAWKVRAMDAP